MVDVGEESSSSATVSHVLSAAAPVGVGHGVIVYSDGTTKQPSPEIMREAQSHLVRTLASQATPEERARLEREVPEAAASEALQGVEPQGPVDLAQLTSDAAVLEWLVDTVPDGHAAVLKQMSLFLKHEISAKRSRQSDESSVSSQSFAIVSEAAGAAYATACAAAGVPNPPAWRSSSWVRQGDLVGPSQNLLQPTMYAEVYTFTSASPAGVCIALPRRDTSSATNYSVVGIICQGVSSSRSCFWDSKRPQGQIPTSATNLAVPGDYFVGGADLRPNGQGVCTDCHAGENSFIIHPATALGLAPNTVAQNWVRPLITAAWPQNAAPGSELMAAGSGCSNAGCHNKASGRRFPRLEDLSGWCTIAGAATGTTMPVSASHDSVIASMCTERDPATRFAAGTKWHDFFVDSTETPLVGDFNGDARTDIVTFLLGSSADVWVALSNGSSAFTPTGKWHDFFGLAGEQLNVGDFNGDGLDDIITATMNSSGTVYVATSTGSTFSASSNWNGHILAGEVFHAGDFNGDRKDDIAIFTKGSTNDVLVQLSSGSSFGSAGVWHGSFSPGSEVPLVGDFNADGYDDIVSFTLGTTHDAMVSLSNGSSFGTATKWHDSFGWAGEVLRVADVNGDGRDDIVTFVLWNNDVYVALSTGSSFAASSLWHSLVVSAGEEPFLGDVDADHRADGIVFTRDAAADVYVNAAIP
ncbi:MAG TPA: VCBS repeat-containing protein [Polyangiaceae bacterium]|nr:VCBS repeat-containing protein [Polyangiaceae bacterium]